MSDDIVRRLRSGFLSPTCALDAADEIKRLRADVVAERELRAIANRRMDRAEAERDALCAANAATMAMAAQASEYMQQAFAEREKLRAKLITARILLKRVNLEFREVLHTSDRDTPTWREAWDLLDSIDAALNKGDGDGNR